MNTLKPLTANQRRAAANRRRAAANGSLASGDANKSNVAETVATIVSVICF